MEKDFCPPRPAHGFAEPLVGRAALIGYAEACGDAALEGGGHCFLSGEDFFGHQRQREHFFFFATEHREDAVRGELCQRFGEVEIVGEFFAELFFAGLHFRSEFSARPDFFAERAHEVGVFGKAFDENSAGTIEGGGSVGYTFVGVYVSCGGCLRIEFRIGEERVGERFEASFLGDYRFGATLLFEGEVNVFETGFGFGGVDQGFQRIRHFALFFNRGDDGGATGFQFAQIGEAFFECAQLCVVECAGNFLAVARDEGNGCTAVEEFDCRRHLFFTDGEFFSNTGGDGFHRGTHDKRNRGM